MLTAYDFPTAAAAAAAGVDILLVGDSMGCVLLGHANTQAVPLDLMVILAEAVRRGAPGVYLMGDLPFESMQGGAEAVVSASRRFRDEAGCDGVKLEVASTDAPLVNRLASAGFEVTAHLGLRPQTVERPEDYRAQARDAEGIAALVRDARNMEVAGAAMLLLEAVPAEASAAVVSAVQIPVLGCGAGPSCHGHVVVTEDLLGLGMQRPPRFVPVLASLEGEIRSALRRYVEAIAEGAYPAAEHVYPLRREPSPTRV